ncbi:hypothetical protein CPB84DRAFT_1854506 [Gymnopilus junonius]|uniref:Uncharacterized protein n=1 Tax=Gymnopilus junonius TaxID=109634 RepID=A0A9P5N7I5_GYMJU|nr:hypothetical protein CPB84DRAFT_1854506 [Gymnopilus junonius]
MAGGYHVTSATFLNFICYGPVSRSHGKAQAELNSLMGCDWIPALEDQKDIEAMVKEVLWATIARNVTWDDWYKGYLILKGIFLNTTGASTWLTYSDAGHLFPPNIPVTCSLRDSIDGEIPPQHQQAMLLPPPISSHLPSSEATTDWQQAFGIPPGSRDSVNMYSALAKPHPGLSALSGEPDGPVQQQQQTPKRKHSRDKGLSTTEEGGVLSNVGSFSEWEYQACDEE